MRFVNKISNFSPIHSLPFSLFSSEISSHSALFLAFSRIPEMSFSVADVLDTADTFVRQIRD